MWRIRCWGSARAATPKPKKFGFLESFRKIYSNRNRFRGQFLRHVFCPIFIEGQIVAKLENFANESRCRAALQAQAEVNSVAPDL
jgi:hypothetical protein